MRTPSASGSVTSASSHWARGQRDGIEFREKSTSTISAMRASRAFSARSRALRHLPFVEEDAHVGTAFQQRGEALRNVAIGGRVAGEDSRRG